MNRRALLTAWRSPWEVPLSTLASRGGRDGAWGSTEDGDDDDRSTLSHLPGHQATSGEADRTVGGRRKPSHRRDSLPLPARGRRGADPPRRVIAAVPIRDVPRCSP